MDKAHRIALFTAVLMLAALARLAALDTLPAGWRDDELIEADLDSRIAAGWRPLYIEEAEGHEPLYHYVHAATIALFGPGRLSYRWLSAACGLVAVAQTLALGKRLFGWQVALLAGIAMAVSLWPLMYSRIGLRHIGTLPLVLLAISNLKFETLAPALRSSPFGSAGVSHFKRQAPNLKSLACGLALAAGVYTYFAGRVVPLIVLAFALYLAVCHRDEFKRQWMALLVAGSVALVACAPLLLYLANRPLESRLEVVGKPLIELGRGNLAPVVETAVGTLGMFTFRGDPEWLYNVSGRPLFDPLTGAFFYLGVALALWRWRQAAYGLLLIWLAGGLAPALVSLPAASFSHTIVALPAVYLAVGLGLAKAIDACCSWLVVRRPQWGKWPFWTVAGMAAAIGILGFHAGLSLHEYAATWNQHRYVRFLYHADVADAARYLNEHPDLGDVAVSTTAEELMLDTRSLSLDLTRSGAQPRLFDPRYALVLPAGEKAAVITISDPLPAPHVEQLLLEQAGLVDVGPPTVNGPAFRLYAAHQVMPDASRGVSLPVTFGAEGQLCLVEIELDPPSLAAGQADQTVQVRTTWRVAGDGALPGALKLFVHLLTADGSLIVTGDRLDVWPPSLRPGDQFVQWNELRVPAGAAPGPYHVAVGLYEPAGARWQIGATGQDRVLVDLAFEGVESPQ